MVTLRVEQDFGIARVATEASEQKLERYFA